MMIPPTQRKIGFFAWLWSLGSVLKSPLLADVPEGARLFLLRKALACYSQSRVQRVTDMTFLIAECLAGGVGLTIGALRFGTFGALGIMCVLVFGVTAVYGLVYNLVARRHLREFLKTPEGMKVIAQLGSETRC